LRFTQVTKPTQTYNKSNKKRTGGLWTSIRESSYRSQWHTSQLNPARVQDPCQQADFYDPWWPMSQFWGGGRNCRFFDNFGGRFWRLGANL